MNDARVRAAEQPIAAGRLARTGRRVANRVRRSRPNNESDSVRLVMVRFAVTGFVALMIVSLVTAQVSRRVGTEQAIEDARRATWVSANGIVAPLITNDLLNLDAGALDAMDNAVRNFVLRGSLIRVKIWDVDGTIVYSDEPRLIGEQFELAADERAVVANGGNHAELSDLGNSENRFEAGTQLLEVYQGVATVEGTPVLFEAYFRYSGVTDVGRQLWRQFAPVALGALVALQLVQFPFAWRMAKRLNAGQAEREQLMQRALDASDAERRRIASDLHDGVVQDLTGVSLGLAALGRQALVDPEQVSDASASIRTSVKSLRSLLVEIYPPNLADEGLESALGDLLSGLPARGITTELSVDPGAATLSYDTAGLVYRVVQEATRNVMAHAAATAIRVEIGVSDDGIGVVVDDDGRGFGSEHVAARLRNGHVGLRTLEGLISDAGGSFDVLSSPRYGTRVAATVPFVVHTVA